MRRKRARAEQWLGEIEGITLTLAFLRSKQGDAARTRREPVHLGLPLPRAEVD